MRKSKENKQNDTQKVESAQFHIFALGETKLFDFSPTVYLASEEPSERLCSSSKVS